MKSPNKSNKKKVIITLEFLKWFLAAGFIVALITILAKIDCIRNGYCFERVCINENQACVIQSYDTKTGKRTQDCCEKYETDFIKVESKTKMILNQFAFGFGLGSLSFGLIIGSIMADRKNKRLSM